MTPIDPGCQRRFVNTAAILRLGGLLLIGGFGPLQAESPTGPAVPAGRPSATDVAPVLRREADGVYRIGEVRLWQTNRTVVFPARVNQREGLVEFLLVAGYGPTHESVLQTGVSPLHLHLAMLALGARGNTNTPITGEARDTDPSGPIAEPSRQPIPGDPIEIELSWGTPPEVHRQRAEDWVWNSQTQSAMTRGPWTYNGSLAPRGVLFAEANGIFAAVVSDRSALINNPRPGRENDDLWYANTNSVPAVGTPVEVRLTFAKATVSPALPAPPPTPPRP